jgi:hypothetical protein
MLWRDCNLAQAQENGGGRGNVLLAACRQQKSTLSGTLETELTFPWSAKVQLLKNK